MTTVTAVRAGIRVSRGVLIAAILAVWVVGYAVLLPLSLPVLFSFQTEGLAILITYEKYFGFVLQIMLGMGLAFEIPLVMMMLTLLGVSSPAGFARFRRFAFVLAAVGGAILSPGTDSCIVGRASIRQIQPHVDSVERLDVPGLA